MSYLVIFIGAGLGGVLRYLMVTGVQQLTGGWAFPIGTFMVNMLGCLVIGFLAQLAESRGVFQSEMKLFLFVGLLGGYTTFSSFGYETIQLLRDGEYLYATLNAVGQLIVGLLMVWLGMIVARLL